MDYDITECRWVDAEHTAFTCLLNDPKLGPIPFTAMPTDPEKTGRDLFAWAVEHCKIAEPDSGQLLADAQAAALHAIDRDAADAKLADIEYRGATYQADEKSERALIDRIAILQASGNTKAKTTWIAADNSQHELTFADLGGLAYVIAERNQAIVLRARTQKDAIEKAKTLEAIVKSD